MRNTILLIAGLLLSFGLGYFLHAKQPLNHTGLNINIDQEKNAGQNMKLGAFSVSLNVRDIKISREFYEKLGFSVLAGDSRKNYLIMKNENSLIGLFQGMFEGNILTFNPNPGWDENGNNIEEFKDVREIHRYLKGIGFMIEGEVDERSSGPAGFMVTDPDGNIILIDQHR